jgi:hippurate hydrolase
MANAEVITRYAEELIAVRHDLHAHPELAFEERRTSETVARLLAFWGYEVHCGLGRTGVVGRLANGTGRRKLGLRADMDALPITEATGLAYASRNAGRMHACGHDGHTTVLLGAARYLAETRRFDGTIHLIFQPAEEDIGGAKRMIEEGLFKLFPCDAVFALHNMPGVEVGDFLFRKGAIMAAVDVAEITVTGQGGHGAMPHLARDPVVAASAIVMALQTIVARNVEPGEEAVVTVGSFAAGTAATIIPEAARLKVGIRSCSDQARDLLERRVVEVARSQAASLGCTVDVAYERSYPCLINSAQEYDLARSVALTMRGEEGVRDLARPFMLSEDFAYMLRELPGCYFFMGNGPTASLHDCRYDFNDDAILPGVRYWAALAERYLAA